MTAIWTVVLVAVFAIVTVGVVAWLGMRAIAAELQRQGVRQDRTLDAALAINEAELQRLRLDVDRDFLEVRVAEARARQEVVEDRRAMAEQPPGGAWMGNPEPEEILGGNGRLADYDMVGLSDRDEMGGD